MQYKFALLNDKMFTVKYIKVGNYGFSVGFTALPNKFTYL